jgi:glycosyltransferase involved in cell wall biosynthesis
MKIALVAPIFEPISPPGEAATVSSFAVIIDQIVQRLAHRHTVEVYSRPTANHAAGSAVQHGSITYRYIDVKRDELITKVIRVLERLSDYPLPKRPFYAASSFYQRYITQCAQHAQAFGAESIILVIFPSFGPWLRKYNPNAQIVLDMQNDWLAQLDPKLVEKDLKHIDLIAACSTFIKDRIEATHPSTIGRCVTLPNGVDASRFTFLAQNADGHVPSHRILYVGRVSPEKGLHVLIDAFRTVAERWPDAELDIVGPLNSPAYEYVIPVSDDPLVRGLKPFFTRWLKRGDANYGKKLHERIPPDLANRISLHGSFPNTQLKPFFEQAGAFCFPAVWDEPFGIPVVEAMATGVPVVTTNSGGIQEFAQHEETALVVPRGDAAALAAALIRILEDTQLRRKLIAQAYEQVARLYTWDKVVEMLEGYMMQKDGVPA